jgi:predicted metal-dependent peptidase
MAKTTIKASDPNHAPPSPDVEYCDLSPELQKKWEMTRTKLHWLCPAFSHVFIQMMAKGKNYAFFTRSIPIAATDGTRLLLNPDTFFNYTLDERIFICVHEIAHCIFDHCNMSYAWWRKGKVPFADGTELPYNGELMNVAEDLVINDMLIESGIGSFNKDWLHKPDIATRNDSALEAYRKLYKDKSGGNRKGKQFDQHLAPGSAEGKDPQSAAHDRNEAQWKAEVAAGLAVAKAQGKLPAGVARAFGEMLEPQVDWRDHIRALMARRLGSGGRSWKRLDRRLAVRGIGAPGKVGYGTGVVVVGVDTSGSIGPKEVDMFFAEMAGILEDVKPERLYIMWCDAKVHRVDECEEAGDLNALRCQGAPGGGGTSFVPVFEEIERLQIRPEALVYLTDGMGTFPQQPSYPVVWGNIYPSSKYPFGDVVQVPKQA